ncbi:MAG: hypothetical protein ABIE23_02585 [archaeon]
MKKTTSKRPPPSENPKKTKLFLLFTQGKLCEFLLVTKKFVEEL